MIYTNTYNKIINKYKSFSIIDKVFLQEIIINQDDQVDWNIISKKFFTYNDIFRNDRSSISINDILRKNILFLDYP